MDSIPSSGHVILKTTKLVLVLLISSVNTVALKLAIAHAWLDLTDRGCANRRTSFCWV